MLPCSWSIWEQVPNNSDVQRRAGHALERCSDPVLSPFMSCGSSRQQPISIPANGTGTRILPKPKPEIAGTRNCGYPKVWVRVRVLLLETRNKKTQKTRPEISGKPERPVLTWWRTEQPTVPVRWRTGLSGGAPDCPVAHRTVRCAHRQQPSPTACWWLRAINTPNHHNSKHPSLLKFSFNTRASAFTPRHKSKD
jgi:hypothetical protein